MAVTRPTNLQKAFCDSGTKNAIPVADQTGSIPNGASYETGFPDITMLAKTSGGLAPLGQDVNGVLNELSAHTKFQNCGGRYRFDAALAAAIGGYPAGFVLQDDAGQHEYVSAINDNTGNFNTNAALIGVTWIPYAGIVLPKVNPNIIVTGFKYGGDIVKTADHQLTISPYSGLDSGGDVQLWYDTNFALTVPSVANTGYFIFIVWLVADGSMTYRTYLSEAAAAADVEVAKRRMVGWWPTAGDTNLREGILKNDILTFGKASESAINSLTAPPAGCNTAISLTGFIPSLARTDSILFGAQTNGASYPICIGYDGTNASRSIGPAENYFGNADPGVWGGWLYGDGTFMPIQSTNIYWGKGASVETYQSTKILIHAIKMRL